jgi:hypothetical protein
MKKKEKMLTVKQRMSRRPRDRKIMERLEQKIWETKHRNTLVAAIDAAVKQLKTIPTIPNSAFGGICSREIWSYLADKQEELQWQIDELSRVIEHFGFNTDTDLLSKDGAK